MANFRDQNAGRIHSVRIDNSSFERVEEFKYLETNLTSKFHSVRNEGLREVRECLLSFGAEFCVFEFAI